MAIQFNPNALSAFSNIDLGKDIAIANLSPDKKSLVKNNELGCFLFKPFRSDDNEAKNNAIRTELLKALGEAFKLKGAVTTGGQTTFTKGFMDELEKILGPEIFKRSDFGIKDGVVDSGKPLTQRRIKAILNVARTKGETAVYDAKTYLAKIDNLTDFFRTKRPQDAQSTTISLGYLGDLRRTIEFLEGDMAGIVEAHDTESFIFRKTGMHVDVRKFSEQVESYRNPDEPMIINIDNINKIRDDQMTLVKSYVKQRLEALVKVSVDLFAEARKSGDVEDFVEVLFAGDRQVDNILTGLEAYNRNLHEDEIVVNNPKPEKIEIKEESQKIEVKEEYQKIEVKDGSEIEDDVEDDEDDDEEITDEDLRFFKESKIGDESVIESTRFFVSHSLTESISDLPKDTQKKFNIFYYTKVHDLEAKGVSSPIVPSAFDDAIDKFLHRFGKAKQTARRLAVELIAEGKLRLFDSQWKVLDNAELSEQCGKIIALAKVIDSYGNHYRHGSILEDIVFKTVLQEAPSDGSLEIGEGLAAYNSEEVDELLEAADSYTPGFNHKFPDTAKKVTKVLREYVKDAIEQFDDDLRKTDDSDLTAAVKRNIFKAFATASYLGNKARAEAHLIKDHYDVLMNDDKARPVIETISPAFESIVKRRLNEL